MKANEDILLSLIQGRPGYEFSTGAIGWTRGTDACTWLGIACDDETGSVREISLTGYKLEATLPSDLSELTTLEVISLSDCGIIGAIPSEVAEMSLLREIDLSLNQLTGTVPHFASTQLAVLSIPNNMLSGPMPILGHVERSNLITINLKVRYGICFFGSCGARRRMASSAHFCSTNFRTIKSLAQFHPFLVVFPR